MKKVDYRYAYIFLALLIGIFLLHSCKKEDDTRPTISLSSPAENEGFSVGDTIHVTGSVQHNKALSSIKIVIRNKQNVAVTATKYLYTNLSSYNIDADYIIDTPGLQTDAYTLVITASDGQNTTYLFRSIHITGIDKYFEKAIVLCRPNALKTYVYSIDSSGNLDNILSINYGFIDSEIASSQRKLFVLKPEPSILYAYDLDDMVPDPLLEASPPYPLFNKVYFNEKLTYVASANGNIIGANQLGNTVYVTPQNPDTIPLLLHRHYNHILSYCERRGGPQHFIMQNYFGTGVYRASLKITFTIKAMFVADEEYSLLFGNHSDGCSIYEYYIQENILLNQVDFPPGEIRDVVEVSSGNYLIAHSSGIFYYSLSTGFLTEWLPGVIVENMALDTTRMILYCSRDQSVLIFRVDNGTLVQELPIPYPIYNIHIQHNI